MPNDNTQTTQDEFRKLECPLAWLKCCRGRAEHSKNYIELPVIDKIEKLLKEHGRYERALQLIHLNAKGNASYHAGQALRGNTP